MQDFKTLWDNALTFDAFQAASTKHKGLWEGLYKIARLPAWATESVPANPGRKLLVIAEDWCGDASSTVPILARLAHEAPGLELRIIRRDEHPEVMERYQAAGAQVYRTDRDGAVTIDTDGISVAASTYTKTRN